MIIPDSIEELAGFVEQDGKKVFLFVADWCGDYLSCLARD